MEETAYTAQHFLSELSIEDRACLYNDLLSIKDVYLCNKDASFYTFRKIKNISKRYTECQRKTCRYQTKTNHELLINQIHEQRIFKNKYRIQVVFNTREYDYDFIEYLLSMLYNSHIAERFAQFSTI